MNTHRQQAALLAAVLILTFALTACAEGSGNVANSPSPNVSALPGAMSPSPAIVASPLLSPSATQYAQTPIDGDSTAQNAQSAQLEQAQTLATAARNIVGVSDAAVVVTDDNKCLVALKLKAGTKLTTKIRSKIIAAISNTYTVRVTDDSVIYNKLIPLAQGMQTGKSVSYNDIKTEWDKIRMAAE